MSLTRRGFIGTAAATPLVLSAGRAAAQADGRPTFTVAVAGLPATLEPARELSNVGTRVTYSIFDTLIRRDFLGTADGGGSELKPHLATSWERKSAQELVVTLRQGVKFHNGDELTADDVAYTFREGRMWGDKALIPGAKPYFGILAGCDVVDRYTVRFRTRVPDVLLEQRLASWCAWIVNKRAYEEMGFEAYSRKPVATGPYKVVSHNPNDSTVLEAFDDYWMGRPTARRVAFKFIPELAARVAGLVAGDYDLITNVPPDQMTVIGQYKDIDVRSVVLANSHVLIFDGRDKVLADKRVRQALSLSIDRQKLVEALWLGKAVVPPSHNYPEYRQMFVEGRSMPFDLARAKTLLKAAGYKGEPIVYRTQANYYTNALEAAQIMVEMWKAVGINASLQVVENSAQLRGTGRRRSSTGRTRRACPIRSARIWVAWGPGRRGPGLDGIWTSAGGLQRPPAPKLEAETDPARRKALFTQACSTFSRTRCPATILYQPSEAYAIRKSDRLAADDLLLHGPAPG